MKEVAKKLIEQYGIIDAIDIAHTLLEMCMDSLNKLEKAVDAEIAVRKLDDKLQFEDWLEKYFDKDDDQRYWTNKYELCEMGMHPDDLSRYTHKDLLEEYKNVYLKNLDTKQYKA